MKSTVLRWEVILDYLGGPNVTTRVLFGGGSGKFEGRRGEGCATTETEIGVMSFEDGARGHGPRKAAVSRSWKRHSTDSPLETPEGTSP